MRPLKFRAWDKNKRRLVFYDLTSRRPTVTHFGDGDPIIYSTLSVWQQFTGLHDKNGKEIYEGDILEWVDAGGESERVVCEWDNEDAQWSFGEAGVGNLDAMYAVIGNIHETPELLK